ncbi:hypothetical protein MTO96_020286 [Rhipicephalus appendiculatus]
MAPGSADAHPFQMNNSRNFKLSDAYNSFVNGKVKRVSSFKAGKRGEGVVLIVACVEASQTLSKTYQSWCVVRDDSAVASAHCTCIAGLGECCTHVAALLFNVEATVRYGLDKQSPPDTACGWIEVTKKAAETAGAPGIPQNLVIFPQSDGRSARKQRKTPGKPEAVLGRAAAASGDTAVADPGG